jgi:predicted RNA binding protein YcfA (HicA-like mRNA interferase family)
VPRLTRVKGSEVIRTLEKLGFLQVRQRGSHVILKKQILDENGQTSEIGCVVPLHKKAIAIGTLKSILNQAGVSDEEFIENL